MSKMRWADSSSDEEDRVSRVPVFQQSGWNDGVVQPVFKKEQQKKSHAPVPALTRSRFDDAVHGDKDSDDADDESDEDVEGGENEDDLEDEVQRQEALRKAREGAQLKKQKDEDNQNASGLKKPLSKKEKQALKAKELDDLDTLLNEFGIANSTLDETTMDAVPLITSSTDADKLLQQCQLEKKDVVEQSESAATTTKKKKNKDVVANSKTDDSMIQQDLNMNEASTIANNTEELLDVASLLKAKVTKKGKEKTAVAEAQKDILLKKEAAAALAKKKKNKDKYAFAPNR